MSNMGAPKLIGALEKPFMTTYLGFHYGFDVVGNTPIKALQNFGDRTILLMHSTKDSQVPYENFNRLMEKAEKEGVNATAFIREGDEHFICYDEYINDPVKDVEFNEAIFSFLEANF